MRSLGFTLIELLTTVSVAGILMSLAVPSFVSMATRNRITTYTNDFIATVNYARSEASRRRLAVTICPSSNGTACSTDWNGGWLMFLNTDNDNPAAVDAGEVVLKTHEALSSGYTLGSTGFANQLVVTANGTMQSTGVFAICHNNETKGARAILVNRMRPRVGLDTDNDEVPNKEGGNIADCAAP
jgi:type IV fimbrial biogenesis protein FimT